MTLLAPLLALQILVASSSPFAPATGGFT